MTDLRYPVGPVTYDNDVTPAKRTAWVRQIAEAPAALRAAIRGLTDAELERPYRPDGWTVRQLVHHVADSHLNAYIRFKWTLTESNPTIKPYDQDSWAKLPDTRLTPVDVSLDLLEAVHKRWGTILEGLHADEWGRSLMHPEYGPMTLDRLLQLYAWHGRHHVAHVTELRRRENF
jgi:hypothetical protein